MKRISCAVLVLAALAVGAVAGPRMARADDVEVDQKVRDRIASHGHVRVLVRSASFEAAPARGLLPSVAAVAGQRQHIAAAQSDVRSRLLGTRHKVIHAYASVPLLALEIDDDALTQLEASGQVVSEVWEDALHTPMLPQSVPLVEGNQAWSAGYDGTGVVVAIVDSGVDKVHPFLANKVVAEACFSSTVSRTQHQPVPQRSEPANRLGGRRAVRPDNLGCWHGTHVAGIAAGNGDHAGQTFSGVAKNAQIIAIQVFSLFSATDCGGSSQCIMAWTSDIIAGLEQVYSLSSQYNISSANLSLGGGLYSSNCDDRSHEDHHRQPAVQGDR